MWSELCPWGTVGVIVDIAFLIIGIVVVLVLTKWAMNKGWVGEKYCIVLLLAVVFATYACAHYDIKRLKCHCEKPLQDGSR